jgi:hypothetical protein
MTSTILQPLSDLVASTIENLATDEPVSAYATDPGLAGIDRLPVAVTGLPTLDRVDVDSPESQFGSYDWTVTLEVTFLFDLGDTNTAQEQALDTIEKFVSSVDAAALSATDASIVDAKVTRSEPAEIVDAARPMLSYVCTLRVLKLVS